MSKHTPGPWLHMNTADIFTPLGSPRADGTEAPPDDGWMIADCDMGGLPLDEVQANARLIAAAPELLEALRGMIALTADILGDYGYCLEGIALREIRDARYVITKATGVEGGEV